MNMKNINIKTRFHGIINDLIKPEKRNRKYSVTIKGNPSVKDIIEAQGVPHPEVDLILINGTIANIGQKLNDTDDVEVYPPHNHPPASIKQRLIPTYPHSPRFILDIHLRPLAKYMRILDIDTYYRNDYTDKELHDIAVNEERILLSKDRGLLKHRDIRWGYCIRGEKVKQQLKEVLIRYFRKDDDIYQFELDEKRFLYRCTVCNYPLRQVNKSELEGTLQNATRQYFDIFTRCERCKRIYWKGSHYEKMLATIHNIIQEIDIPLSIRKTHLS